MVDTRAVWWKFLRILGFEDVGEFGVFVRNRGPRLDLFPSPRTKFPHLGPRPKLPNTQPPHPHHLRRALALGSPLFFLQGASTPNATKSSCILSSTLPISPLPSNPLSPVQRSLKLTLFNPCTLRHQSLTNTPNLPTSSNQKIHKNFHHIAMVSTTRSPSFPTPSRFTVPSTTYRKPNLRPSRITSITWLLKASSVRPSLPSVPLSFSLRSPMAHYVFV